MKKYYVYHDDNDSYVDADEVSLTPGGELCFCRDSKLMACFQRGCWSYFKETEIEEV